MKCLNCGSKRTVFHGAVIAGETEKMHCVDCGFDEELD